jgi:hypothetical protein
VIQKTLPKLTVTLGDEDWFLVETSAQGSLIVDVLFADAELLQDDLLLELRSETGTSVVATSTELRDSGGNLIGERITAPATGGDRFQVRIAGVGDDVVDYELHLESLTANLGARVQTTVPGSIANDDRASISSSLPRMGLSSLC